ncbi:MAG: hypothetical protein SNJ52_01650 [Verrucomicrobiia bacterium]
MSEKLYRLCHALSEREADRRLAEAIQEGLPLMVSRLGTVEMAAVTSWQANGYSGMDPDLKAMLQANAGVFPIDADNVAAFCSISLDAMQSIDLLGIRNGDEDIKMARHFGLKAKAVSLVYLSPIESVVRYSRHLEGRKVLVIHPFAESIGKQFARRELLFSDPSILPDFQLDILPAVQSLGAASMVCGHANWVTALRHMTREMESRDFDIALIGAGAYGMPLAARAKAMGKVAIHVGGALQLLFGIRGKRWENYDLVARWVNESWVWPVQSERPIGAEKVEKGCYW